MNKLILSGLIAAMAPVLSAGAAEGDCEAAGGVQFVCGPVNAEDLVRVPETNWIIASGMGGSAALTLVNTNAKDWHELFPGESPNFAHDRDVYGLCPRAPDTAQLVTHGLSIRAGEQGHSTLHVVAHGGRESIEIFDVDATGDRPVLTWIGCVPMPEGLAANSVASLPGGGIVATVLLMPGTTFTDQLEGRPTGAVFEWQPGLDEFKRLVGSELPGNNGIEASADGRELYVVSSGLHTVTAFAHSNPILKLRESLPLPFTPDNVHMGPDGRLLTAGMKDDVAACGGPPGPQHDLEQLSTCPRGFMAVAIEPESMREVVIAESPEIEEFSNATMVLTVGDEFYIGTFSGDRIAYGSLD